MYFGSVGGETLEAVVANMNAFGTSIVCVGISEYKDVGKQSSLKILNVFNKRIRIQGCLATDCMKGCADFISTTLEYFCTGYMQALEHITLGLENIPSAFVGLCRGDNIRKKIVKIVDK